MGDDLSFDLNKVLSRARMTMKFAKQDPLKPFVVFDQGVDADIKKHEKIKTGLVEALKEGHISVHYQPVVQAHSKDLVGFEALIRWQDPEVGFIRPDEFIPAAELSGEILHLGRFVVKKACDLLMRLEKDFKKKFSISVNVSVVELLQQDYCDYIKHVLDTRGLAPHRLMLEVTESMDVMMGSAAENTIHALRHHNIKVALDDFGTGYASFGSLIKLPYSVVKLDRIFMERIVTSPVYSDMVGAVTRLCHHHDIKVVAEGIETQEMTDLAESMGVDFLQGYLFAKPLDQSHLMTFIESKLSKNTLNL